MASSNPVNTIWSMHTWQGAVEPIMTPGPEIGNEIGPWTDLRDVMVANDPAAWIEPLRIDEANPETSTYWTDGPHLQFGVTTVLVEGSGNIMTQEANMETGRILIESISAYYR
jgi:hypothetical protein